VITFLDLIPRWVLLMAIGAALVWGGVNGVKLSSARADVVEAERTTATLRQAIAVANTEAAQKTAALSNAVLKATNESKIRETSLRAAAAAAASDLAGLRDDLAAMREHLAGATRDSILKRTDAVAAVLADCSRKYQGMAEVAERHSSDVRTLIEAWPR